MTFSGSYFDDPHCPDEKTFDLEQFGNFLTVAKLEFESDLLSKES